MVRVNVIEKTIANLVRDQVIVNALKYGIFKASAI
jgi:hypothetical protein